MLFSVLIIVPALLIALGTRSTRRRVLAIAAAVLALNPVIAGTMVVILAGLAVAVYLAPEREVRR